MLNIVGCEQINDAKEKNFRGFRGGGPTDEDQTPQPNLFMKTNKKEQKSKKDEKAPMDAAMTCRSGRNGGGLEPALLRSTFDHTTYSIPSYVVGTAFLVQSVPMPTH